MINKLISQLTIIFVIILCYGCEENSLALDPNTNTPTSESYYINASIPNKGRIITLGQLNLIPNRQYVGAGYDVTGAYLANSSVKAPIFDLSKFTEGNYAIFGSGSHGENFVGRNANEYLLSINRFKNIEVPKENSEDLLFTETITKNELITSSFDYSEQFTFASINENSSSERHLLLLHNNHYGDYINSKLTPEFKSDISTLSAEEIISKYGTHVIREAHIGYNINYFYRTVINADDKNKEIEKIAMAGIGQRKESVYYNPNVTIGFDEEDVMKNYGGCIAVEFCGGDPNTLPNYTVTQTDIIGGPLDIRSWISSVNNANYILTKIGDDGLMPIYQLFKDEVLIAKLKEATTAYIKSKQIEIIQTVPIFNAYHKNDYRYFTSYADMKKNCDQGYINNGVIGSLFKEKVKNSTPLYQYSNGINDRLSFDANLTSEHGMELKGIIGYCFEEMDKAMQYFDTLYEITNGEKYIYTHEHNYKKDKDWEYTGNIIYTRSISGNIV